MSQFPFLKFFPADWRSDTELRSCSLAARGLWIEMMGLMHESKRYGHLVVGGRIVDVDQLATLVGATTQEVSDLLGQLEKAGVFSKSSDSSIYSRRMARENQRSNVNRKNCKKRWDKEKDKGKAQSKGQPTDLFDKNSFGNTKPDTRKKPRGQAPKGALPTGSKMENVVEGGDKAIVPLSGYPAGSWQHDIVEEFGKPTLDNWFRDVEVDGGRMTVKKQFCGDWIRNNYGAVLRRHGFTEITHHA